MKERYKVSVIVAIYNIENYVAKCIDSIINQDYKNLEIILVDDYSCDSTGAICDSYSKRDDRIKVIHHTINKRHSVVRNDGLDASTGDYVVFVDGDDWLAEDFVSYMLNVITTTESDMAINLVNFSTRDMTQVDNEPNIEIWSAEKATAELLFPHVTVGCWNKIYKREFIEKHNLRFRLNLFTAEGDRFINDAAQRANKVGIGCRKVYYYRMNNINSATTKYDIGQSLGAIEAFVGLEKDLIIRTPIVINALNQHIWLNHLWNVRQMLALNLEQKYNKEYRNSLSYVKSNFLNATKDEPSLNKRVKYCITGIFPVISSKVRNYRFDSRLRKDIKYFETLKKEGKNV